VLSAETFERMAQAKPDLVRVRVARADRKRATRLDPARPSPSARRKYRNRSRFAPQACGLRRESTLARPPVAGYGLGQIINTPEPSTAIERRKNKGGGESEGAGI